MTLYKQLTLSILLLLLATFLGTVIINTQNLRSFLLTQLESHAQDTATSLGLSLSRPLQVRDITLVSAMVNAVFDRGDFQEIKITAIDGVNLLSRSSVTGNPDVPGWFIELLDLQPAVAEALVMSGWQQAGKVHVSSHPGHAYTELWKNSVDLFQLFLGLAIVITLAGLLALYLLLRPLRRLETQADAICNGTYPIQKTLPRTRELRRVVTAMNRMSGKIGNLFTGQSELTESLREQAYRDPVTGLGNRRYFDRQLRTLLESREESSTGALLLLELHGLSEINRDAGYPAGDQLLKQTAGLINTRIRQLDNCFAARISGADYAIVATGLDQADAESLAEKLCHDLLHLFAAGLASAENNAHIGIALWNETGTTPVQQQDSVSNLLASADTALRVAQARGKNSWECFTPTTAGLEIVPGSSHWRDFLQQAIESDAIRLFTQAVVPVQDPAGVLPHQEVLLRIPDAAGNQVTASVIIPLAERMGLATDIDRLAFSKLLQHIKSNTRSQTVYAFNLCSSSLHNPVFIQWLCSQLENSPGIARQLLIEFPEYGALANIQNTRNCIDRLVSLGCQCGLDHFGRGFHSFGYLRNIGASYLKIDGSYTRGIEQEDDNRFLVRALADTAHSVDITVIAQAVETRAERDALLTLHLDGLQGFFTGKPQPVNS